MLAMEFRQCLAGLHHYGVGLAAAATLADDLGRQFHNRSADGRHGLLRLSAQLGLGHRWCFGPSHHEENCSVVVESWSAPGCVTLGCASNRVRVKAKALYLETISRRRGPTAAPRPGGRACRARSWAATRSRRSVSAP